MSAAAGRSTTANGLPYPEGSPGALDQAAQALRDVAQGNQTVADGLAATAAATGGWTGAAADAFRALVEAQRAGLMSGADQLHQAAGAVRRLSTTLEEAQDDIRRLDRQVGDAEEEAQRAAARAVLTQGLSAAADAALGLAGADPPAALERAAQDASDDAAVAGRASADAQTHAAEVRRRAERRARDLCEDVEAADTAASGAVQGASAAAPLGGRVGAIQSPSMQFAERMFRDVPIERWRAFAYHQAGIDGGRWHPELGYDFNEETILASYAYYGELFGRDRDFQWAGMANIVAPTFLAGFQDLAVVRRNGGNLDLTAYARRQLIGDIPGPFDEISDRVSPLGNLGRLGAAEAGAFERQFLTMQKLIFDDLAWQHEAYAIGGIGLMRELHGDNGSTRVPVEAWEKIAAGDVAGGNRDLLYREQRDVIQRNYDQMRDHHGPVGEAFTTVLTISAESPVPGGRSYMDLNHRTLEIPLPPMVPQDPGIGPFRLDVPGLPDGTVDVRVPEGNIADFDDRWGWIEGDMLPAYQDRLAEPGVVESIIREPVAERAEDHRMLPGG